jgi:hypothetical protein
MTYDSDTQLRAHGFKPLRELPNRDGFKFTGITRMLAQVKCWVTRDPHTGQHSVDGHDWDDLIAWK